MDILFAATELAPYARDGGLAEVMAALSKTLRQHGHKVTLALPRYPHFERAGLLVARRLTPLHIELGGTSHAVTIYDGRLPSGVELTLLDLPGLFDREGLYGDGATDYADNHLRFAVFSRAVLEMVRQRLMSNMTFDIVHANDWPTALIPFYARLPENQAVAAASKFVLTIHNIAYQGIAPASMLGPLGIPAEYFHPEGAEFYGSINVLKTGILYADAVTTVSDRYAREIETEERGSGLHGVLTSRASRVAGITNGIDYALWNPATDAALIARYDAHDPSGKALCKAALLSSASLEMVPERPVVTFAERFAAQKGFDLFLDAMPLLLRSDAAFVIAGKGDRALAARAEALAAASPGRVAFLPDPPDPVLHRLIAGSDVVVAPSRFEPCGHVQQYGMRYGAVPVARATGGLADTVVDCDAALETGTGFLFDDATVEALVGGVQRALAAFTSPRWPALRRRVMRLDLGWDRAAHRYEQLYRSLVTP
jgi:starch synthase